jgi:hypothetical protein
MVHDVEINKGTRADWLSYFLFGIVQDTLINPLLYFISNLILLMITNSKKIRRNKIDFVRFLNRRILSKRFQVLYLRFKKVSPLLKIKNDHRKVLGSEDVKKQTESVIDNSRNQLFSTNNDNSGIIPQILEDSQRD